MSLLLALTGGSGPTNYTLTASAGSYALTGGSATLTKTGGAVAYSLTASAGAYALSGGTAALKVARRVTANAGSYSLTGGTASLKVARKITALAGSYSVVGGNATLTKSAGATAYALTALPGAYAVTGGSATLSKTSPSEERNTGGYGHLGRTQSKDDKRKERIRLGIEQEEVKQAVAKVARAVVADHADDPVEYFDDNRQHFMQMLLDELQAQDVSRDALAQQIRIALAIHQEEEEILLLLM